MFGIHQIVRELKRIRHLFDRPFILDIEGTFMDVIVGQTANFTVVAKNAAGTVVPDTNISVTVDANGTATVNADGTGGVFTATSVGSANIVATDGTLTSPPVSINCVADTKPATLEIVFA